MDDIRELTLNIKYQDVHSLSMDLEPKFMFVYKTIFDSFDRLEVESNPNLSRYVMISAELFSLNDVSFNKYFKEDEVKSLVSSLVEEQQILRNSLNNLRDINTKNKVSSFDTFDTRISALKTLFNINEKSSSGDDNTSR